MQAGSARCAARRLSSPRPGSSLSGEAGTIEDGDRDLPGFDGK